MDKMNEQTYLDSVETHDGLVSAYYCISDGLSILSQLYRNAHLNFDGNTKVDSFFEEWMNDTFTSHFNILHRIRIVTSSREKVFPLFGLDKMTVYSPIRAFVERFFGNTSVMGIANDLAEAIDFISTIEEEFLRMVLELYSSVIKDVDPTGEGEVQAILDASEKRLLDTSGIIEGLFQ